jgi:hypothetical protein
VARVVPRAGYLRDAAVRDFPMRTRIRQATVGFIVLFALAQVIRPGRANPPTEASRTIQAQAGTTTELVTILDRACRDCHSNGTEWPWYTQVAPVSWLMAYGVREGRRAVNFSDWAAYTPERQRGLLVASCKDVTAGKMPGLYTLLHSETRLSDRDVEIICAAAQVAQVEGAGGH